SKVKTPQPLVRNPAGRNASLHPPILQPAPFLLEIGTEELPAGDLDSALEQLRLRLPALLGELRLEHVEVCILGTPRRQVAFVKDLAPQQPDIEQVIKGPPADRAFGPDGALTRAGEGFARSKGIDPGDLQVREMDGGRYAVAVVRQAGRPAAEVLAEALPGLVASLHFEKSMRWNSSNVFYSRPIRWLLALYGEGDASQVTPFEYAGLLSGNVTRGLRFCQPDELVIHSPGEYFDLLAGQGILLDMAHRQGVIQEQVLNLAAEVQGGIASDPGLLSEVANLVETPTALRGTFDPSHLKLPREVLISVMKKHQRYFPVETVSPSQGKDKAPVLLPYFIAVRNGDQQGLDLVQEGNEHVIRARFADAAFFIREDVKQPLEAYLPRLSTLTFQVKLGSMLDKTHRMMALVGDLAGWVGVEAAEQPLARRAAELCKADLATQMVIEMTALQGIMGRYYALKSGEPEPVALALFEHYLPRYAGDLTPRTRLGLLVGLADRLDTLAGLFAAGLAPSGNKDPFAQRRAALGLVQNLIAWDLDFDLQDALQAAAARLPIPASPESQAQVLDFITERLRNILLEQGLHYDAVDAVLAAQGQNPARAAKAIRELTEWVGRPDWNTILPAYARCVRITRGLAETYPVQPGDFADPAERELYQALQQAEAAPRRAGSANDFLNAFLPMIPVINRFFDEILVMAEDPHQRENRLGLLQRIAALASGAADMSKLEGF
ncbi:MAG TPA: glycine--tRNA ligase subunit beta, partial [Anaerolineales bacterium]